MITEYYDFIILLMHVILGIESFFCSLVFIKYFSFAKKLKKWDFISILKFAFWYFCQISLILYCYGYCLLEYNFITHYYEEDRFYFYEIYAMSMQIIFMAIFVSKYYERRDNVN